MVDEAQVASQVSFTLRASAHSSGVTTRRKLQQLRCDADGRSYVTPLIALEVRVSSFWCILGSVFLVMVENRGKFLNLVV